MSRVLPAKLRAYLARLEKLYSHSDRAPLAEIIRSAKIAIVEDADFDNWNGGTWGHEVKFFVPLDLLGAVPLDEVSKTADAIKNDLNKLAEKIPDEWVSAVHLEMEDDADPDCANAQQFAARPVAKPESLHFWRDGYARAFISHRDQHKAAARELSLTLNDYGISCFVAHDTIQPMSEWRAEIMKGLETMEIMLVFLTDDFEESVWTNQEIGYALAKGVPVISLKLGSRDPPGFISHVQALKGRIDNLSAAARSLFPIIIESLGRKARIQEMLVSSFTQSMSFVDARDRFDRMHEFVERLTDKQVALIVDSFETNNQLHGSGYLNYHSRLRNFLEATGGGRFEFNGRKIVRRSADEPRAEIPF
jgi:hypothetical protein